MNWHGECMAVFCHNDGEPFMLGSFLARLCPMHKVSLAREWFPNGRVPSAPEGGVKRDG